MLRSLLPAAGVIAATALFAVLAGAAQARPRRPVRLSSAIVSLAKKWAAARGLPATWVLATIIVESGGDPYAVGDGGVSRGLMQINTRAHADRLARAGVSPQALFDPNVNLEWGTLLLREAHDRARAAGASPLDAATRLVYRGYAPATIASRGVGVDASSVAAWSEALARSSALV